MSWSTSELRVRLAPLNRFKPSSKIFYWPFQGGTSFVDLLCFCSVLCLLCFVRVCLYVLRGHQLGKGWPLGSRLWCLLWVCHFPIGILGQVWYLIVSIPDLCNLTYFDQSRVRLWTTVRRLWPIWDSFMNYNKRALTNLGFVLWTARRGLWLIWGSFINSNKRALTNLGFVYEQQEEGFDQSGVCLRTARSELTNLGFVYEQQ